MPTMAATTSTCRWLHRLWLVTLLLGWPSSRGAPSAAGRSIPLDMGGADPSRDAAYQAAQLQHVARALGLGIGGPGHLHRPETRLPRSAQLTRKMPNVLLFVLDTLTCVCHHRTSAGDGGSDVG